MPECAEPAGLGEPQMPDPVVVTVGPQLSRHGPPSPSWGHYKSGLPEPEEELRRAGASPEGGLGIEILPSCSVCRFIGTILSP